MKKLYLTIGLLLAAAHFSSQTYFEPIYGNDCQWGNLINDL